MNGHNFSLYPHPNPLPKVGGIIRDSQLMTVHSENTVILNLLAFIPIGFLLHAYLRNRFGASVWIIMGVLFIGGAFTVGIKSLPIYLPTRNASMLAGSGTSFDIWYAQDQGNGIYYQSFGKIGIPQRWVNILGNVSDPDGLETLTYSLRGGPQKSLTIGPDGHRLQSPGDFNVEIAFTDLVPSPKLNRIVITATDSLGNQSQVTVDVEYFDGNVWPATYSVDWNDVQKIDAASQIVDGLWTLENGTVRTAIPGYDRLIAIGDVLWEDYEVSVPITIHSILSGVNRPGVGVLLRWDGHHAWDNAQPTHGWYPMGILGWYRYVMGITGARLEMIGGESDLDIKDTSGKKMTFGVTYNFEMRVETISGIGSRYSMKVWEQGQAEPSRWDLVGEEDFSSPLKGSLLLLAHNTDASFGKVTVSPLSASSSPIITMQPADQSIIEGQSATFSVTAAGTSPLSYQWRKNGTDIIGATGAYYTTPAATLADDGVQFFCVVTNDYGSVFSNTTTLNVLPLDSSAISHNFNVAGMNMGLCQFFNQVGDESVSYTVSHISIPFQPESPTIPGAAATLHRR